jgi:hypothetical protein
MPSGFLAQIASIVNPSPVPWILALLGLEVPTLAEATTWAGAILSVGGLIGTGLVTGYSWARRQLRTTSIQEYKDWEEARKGTLTAENETLKARLAEAEKIGPRYQKAIDDLARLGELLAESIEREVSLATRLGALTGELSEVRKAMGRVNQANEEIGAQVQVNAAVADSVLMLIQQQPPEVGEAIRRRMLDGLARTTPGTP